MPIKEREREMCLIGSWVLLIVITVMIIDSTPSYVRFQGSMHINCFSGHLYTF